MIDRFFLFLFFIFTHLTSCSTLYIKINTLLSCLSLFLFFSFSSSLSLSFPHIQCAAECRGDPCWSLSHLCGQCNLCARIQQGDWRTRAGSVGGRRRPRGIDWRPIRRQAGLCKGIPGARGRMQSRRGLRPRRTSAKSKRCESLPWRSRRPRSSRNGSPLRSRRGCNGTRRSGYRYHHLCRLC